MVDLDELEEKQVKNFCENIDGRLGYVCTTNVRGLIEDAKIPAKVILAVSQAHVTDGKPNETLCLNCLAYKHGRNRRARQNARLKNCQSAKVDNANLRIAQFVVGAEKRHLS
jgi:hypothetical protein